MCSQQMYMYVERIDTCLEYLEINYSVMNL